MTEDAEIDLKYAKQDAETFDLLMGSYSAKNDYMVPRAIKKEDFMPTIDEFIEERTAQINQLNRQAEMFPKGSGQYAENQAKRTKLAKERSSARRLQARYFNVPKSETTAPSASESSADSGMGMEQTPAGKTEEQIEAEESKKKREENEQKIKAEQETEAKRQQEIRQAREAVRRSYSQKLEEEQEEEMEM